MRISILLFTITLLASCGLLKRNSKEISVNKFKKSRIPGVIEISKNYYLDGQEVVITNWHEYAYWNKRVYGPNSKEYKACEVDSATWLSPSKYHDSTMQYWYNTHTAYWHYPIVGISYKQAERYTEWRSKMVFLMMLYKHKIIPIDTSIQFHKDFSIEYFYTNPKYSKFHYLPFPQYSLPSKENYYKHLQFADSSNQINLKHCRQRSLLYKFGTRKIYCDKIIIGKPKRLAINAIDTSQSHFLRPTDCFMCKKPVVFHLQGNVAEFTSDSTIVTGGHWLQSLDTILNQPFQTNKAPNNYTGFRNSCSWQFYKKD